MSKASSVFVCQQCNYQAPKWLGQCPNCGAWNSLVETVVARSKRPGGMVYRSTSSVEPIRLSEVRETDYGRRISTGISEVDRVLGGGLVPGGVVLVAGEPGIGKSTLLLQIASLMGGDRRVLPPGSPTAIPLGNNSGAPSAGIPASRHPSAVVYIAGEESAGQIAARARRLGLGSESVLVLEETDAEEIISQIGLISPIGLIIVDSIQTLTTSDLAGTAGSIGQVRECAGRLTAWAKKAGVPMFLIGHVTKEGSIAGPRVLEHMVDTVLWFEGDRREVLRLVRAVKNRFGPTDEVGIFSMEEKGLVEVANPSAMFLSEDLGRVSGQVVTSVLEGTRPVLVEIEALVVPTKLAFPKRAGSGVDPRRLEIIVAVLQRRCGLPLWEQDIFVNVSGGIRVSEPGADLAIALAIASSFYDKPVKAKSCAIGEVGLLGNVRPVAQLDRRTKEAKRQGFTLSITSREVRTVGEAIKRMVG